MIEDINSRIQQVIRDKSMNAATFADEIGVQRSSISHILSGRNKPSIDFIQKLLDKYKNIDSYWLLTGKSLSSSSVINKEENAHIQLNVVKSHETNSTPSLFDEVEKNLPINSVKKIEKVLTFYTDKTFDEYYPNK